MGIKIIYPNKILSGFIKYYWVFEEDIKAPIIERIIPTGMPQIIFHYREPFQELKNSGIINKQSQSIISGQVTNYLDVAAKSKIGMIGIIFKPYGLCALLPIPLNELTDYSINSWYIQKDFQKLEEMIIEKNTLKERIALIEDTFQKILNISNHINFETVKFSVEAIMACKGQMVINNLNNKIGFSQRHFERIFKEYIGISPKQFIEITKINHAVSLFSKYPRLTKIAYETGYYDQPHFIRKFKSHTGLTPKEFRKRYNNSAQNECHITDSAY